MRKTLKQFASLFLVLALVLAMVPAMGEPVEASGGFELEFSPAGGTYSEPQNVKIEGLPQDTDLWTYGIYYTLDDTEPTMSSLKYTSGQSISVTRSTTIKAILFYQYESGDPEADPNGTASASYVINAPRHHSSSTGTSTVTVPVSGDSGSVPVTASVNNGTATVQKPSDNQLDKILGEGVKTGEVSFDVSGLGKNITTANIPTETVKAVEKAVNDENNDATAMTVILSDGQITLDGKALTAITDQATGDDIRLNLDDVKISTLNTAQREAVNDLEVEVVLDAYITSNGQRISDFRGGKATVSVPYTLKNDQQPKGLVVWYVADDGTRTNMNASYDGKNIVFVVPHFSNYVVAYDESLLQEKVSDCPKDSTCPISAFTDAKADAWYHDGVHWALENNVMKGFNKTQFGPSDDTTRAQVATMIWRLAGSPAAKKAATFTDVASGLWYTDSIAWAAENGVVTGYTNRAGNLVFDPNGAVTREQLAAMIYRYAKLNGLGYKNIQTFQLGYPDASTVADWGFEPMAWLSEKGVINGIGGNLDPQAKASRAQVATMLMRFWSLEK